MDKVGRILDAAAVVGISETFDSKDEVGKKAYALGSTEKPRRKSKKIPCYKCKKDIWLTGDTLRIVEEKKAKPVCAKCALQHMKRLKNVNLAMFKKDKEQATKFLNKELNKELDNAIPYRGN